MKHPFFCLFVLRDYVVIFLIGMLLFLVGVLYAHERDAESNLWLNAQELEYIFNYIFRNLKSQDNVLDTAVQKSEYVNNELDGMIELAKETNEIWSDVSDTIDNVCMFGDLMEDYVYHGSLLDDHIQSFKDIVYNVYYAAHKDMSCIDQYASLMDFITDIADAGKNFFDDFIDNQSVNIAENTVNSSHYCNIFESALDILEEVLGTVDSMALSNAHTLTNVLEIGDLLNPLTQYMLQASETIRKNRKRDLPLIAQLVHDTQKMHSDVNDIHNNLSIIDKFFDIEQEENMNTLLNIVDQGVEQLADAARDIELATKFMEEFIEITDSIIDEAASIQDQYIDKVYTVEKLTKGIHKEVKKIIPVFYDLKSINVGLLTICDDIAQSVDSIEDSLQVITQDLGNIAPLIIDTAWIADTMYSFIEINFQDDIVQEDCIRNTIKTLVEDGYERNFLITDIQENFISSNSILDFTFSLFDEIQQYECFISSQLDYVDNDLLVISKKVMSDKEYLGCIESVVAGIQDVFFGVHDTVNSLFGYVSNTDSIVEEILGKKVEINFLSREFSSYIDNIALLAVDFLGNASIASSLYDSVLDRIDNIVENLDDVLEKEYDMAQHIWDASSILDIVYGEDLDPQILLEISKNLDCAEGLSQIIFDLVEVIPIKTQKIFERVHAVDLLTEYIEPRICFLQNRVKPIHVKSDQLSKFSHSFYTTILERYMVLDDLVTMKENNEYQVQEIGAIAQEIENDWSILLDQLIDLVEHTYVIDDIGNDLMNQFNGNKCIWSETDEMSMFFKNQLQNFSVRFNTFDMFLKTLTPHTDLLIKNLRTIVYAQEGVSCIDSLGQLMSDKSFQLNRDVDNLLEETEDFVSSIDALVYDMHILFESAEKNESFIEEYAELLNDIAHNLNVGEVICTDIIQKSQELKGIFHLFIHSQADNFFSDLCSVQTTLESLEPLFTQLSSNVSIFEQNSIGFFSKANVFDDKVSFVDDNINMLDSQLDIIQEVEEFVAEILCTEESIIEGIEDTFNDVRSDVEQIHSSVDSVLSKSCIIESMIDQKILPNVIRIDSNVEVAVSIVENTLEKACSLIEEVSLLEDMSMDIESKTEVLSSSFDGIVSEVCDIQITMSQIEDNFNNIHSSINVIESKNDSILDDLDLVLASCTHIIRNEDIPFTITERGVYCLVENTTFTGGTSIEIVDTSCVVFDLHGHEIRADSTADGIHITNSSNIIIRNGSICDGQRSIIVGDNSEDVIVRDISIKDSENGISVQDSMNITVAHVSSSANTGSSFIVDTSSMVVFKDVISLNSFQGFMLASGVTQSCCIRCKVVNVQTTGFFDMGMSNLVVESIVHMAGTEAFHLSGMVYVVRESMAFDSTDGFFIDGSNGLLRANISINNENAIDIDASATNTSVIGSYIVGRSTASGSGISDSGTDSRVFNNLVHNAMTNYSGIPLATIETIMVTKDTGFWANISQ